MVLFAHLSVLDIEQESQIIPVLHRSNTIPLIAAKFALHCNETVAKLPERPLDLP